MKSANQQSARQSHLRAAAADDSSLTTEQLRAVLAMAADAIVTIDERGIVIGMNQATTRMFGYTEAELLGQNVKVLMPAPFCDEHDAYIARYMRTREPHIIGIGREVVARRKDGSTFPIDLAVAEIDHLNIFTGIIRDVSERKDLQAQVVEIASEEQRRLGQELHDSVGQLLTGLGLHAGTLEQLLDTRSSAADMSDIVALAKKLNVGLQQVSREIRDLSRGAMPVQIDPEGLRASLVELADSIDGAGGIRCRWQGPTSLPVSDIASATHLYRIVQEAVQNAIRHSQASQITIHVEADEDRLCLEVRDDGRGFDRRQGNEGGSSGVGLKIMAYRASLIGATLHIGEAEGGGTLVRCLMPQPRRRR